jgi:hypothetical protein
MSRENVETFKRAVDAFNRGDIDAVLEELDAEVEWHPVFLDLWVPGVDEGDPFLRHAWHVLDRDHCCPHSLACLTRPYSSAIAGIASMFSKSRSWVSWSSRSFSRLASSRITRRRCGSGISGSHAECAGYSRLEKRRPHSVHSRRRRIEPSSRWTVSKTEVFALHTVHLTPLTVHLDSFASCSPVSTPLRRS